MASSAFLNSSKSAWDCPSRTHIPFTFWGFGNCYVLDAFLIFLKAQS